MKRLFSNPNTLEKFNQIAVYLLFIIFTAGSFLISLGFHSNILQIATVFNASRNFYRVMYTGGTFLLFIPYVLLIGLLEEYLRAGYKKNLLWKRAKKIFIVEAGLGILILLISWVTTILLLRSP